MKFIALSWELLAQLPEPTRTMYPIDTAEQIAINV